jgi:kynurenine formamidase
MKKIIDLTHLINEKMTVYPNTLQPEFEPSNTIKRDGFAELKISMATHTGTHIDAPCHLLAGTKSLDGFPMDKFAGKAVVIDCEGETEVSLKLLKSKEKLIKKAEFVLFSSGWSKKWNKKTYFGKFPVLTEEAALWLAGFDLKAVGFDYISVDAMTSADLPNHRVFLSKEILIIENLAGLDKLPDGMFDFFAIPLKIEGADGSPVRAFAVL